MRWIYHRGYNFARGIPFLREMHGFVLDKPARIRSLLTKGNAALPSDFEAPTIVSDQELAAVHGEAVLMGLRSADAIAEAAELRPLARLPLALARHLVVTPQLLACGGTAVALHHASAGRWATNLGGGFHHARPELSHGFCLVNDVAWGVHCLRQSGDTSRVLILDLDLHQGDGNAAMFASQADVFTASLHQEDTFPIPKLSSDLDIGLRGGTTGDEEYHAALTDLFDAITGRFTPQIVVYIAGTDPYRADAIGAFQLSKNGLIERDRRVARFVASHGASLVALPGGGYSGASPSIAAAGFAAMAQVEAETAGRFTEGDTNATQESGC